MVALNAALAGMVFIYIPPGFGWKNCAGHQFAGIGKEYLCHQRNMVIVEPGSRLQLVVCDIP